MTERVLVVDDEKLIRWSLKEQLSEAGYSVDEAEDGATAFEKLSSSDYELMLLDFKLPDTDGLKILERVRVEHPDLSIIMITAHSNVEHAVTAMHAGASDYLAKPFNSEDIRLRIEKVLENSKLRREIKRLRKDQLDRYCFDRMIGQSEPMRKLFRLVDRVVSSPNATILVQGESGTGKDVLAKAIHFGGPRAAGPYTNITCTAIPEQLLESELFGHEKGAFTDARQLKQGLVEQSNGGTLFLDEIGDMSGYLQGKLLRFLEEKTFRRVGGNQDLQVDVRVIAATNKDLKKLVQEGTFREDLYFRLKVIPIMLPPLRERREDISLLVQHFIDDFNRELKKDVKGCTPQLLKRLEQYDWPGNIRELRNSVERAMILGGQEYLDESDLPVELFDESEKGSTTSNFALTEAGLDFETLEKNLVIQALTLTRGNQTRAGRLLGMNRDQIRYRVEKFKLQDYIGGDASTAAT